MDITLWKDRKKELKLTNQKISDISGIPKRTIEDIFSGATKTPRSDTVDAIEQVLGITKDQTQSSLSIKEQEIVDLLMQFDEKQLDDVLSVIKIIAKK